MNLLPASRHSRKLILLGPRGVELKQFVRAVVYQALHTAMLSERQKFSAEVCVAGRILMPSALTPDGRHVQPADSRSWHLLTPGDDGRTQAGGRILLHPSAVYFSDLVLSHLALAHSAMDGVQ